MTPAHTKSLIAVGVIALLPFASPTARGECAGFLTALGTQYVRFTEELIELPCRIVTNLTNLPEHLNPTSIETR